MRCITMKIYLRKQLFTGSVLLLIIFHCCSILPALVSAESLPEHQNILKAASELDYPPFAEVKPDGTAAGFSVDLLKAATDAVGLSVSFKVGPWNAIKQELVDKKIDVLPLVSYSKERDKVYDFTAPYLRMNGTVFVRKGNTAIQHLSDLQDKEVLVMQGDTAHEYVVTKKLSKNIIPTVSYDEAFTLLASGKHDAVVVQQIVGLQMIKKLHIANVVPVKQKVVSSLKPMALKLEGFEQKFCFAVPEGSQDVLSLLNEGLAIIYLNGTYNTLYDKWFAPILPTPIVPLSKLIKQTLLILVPLLLVFTLLGLWYLKRLVNKRTTHLELEIKQRKTIESELADANAKYVKAQEIGKVGNWEYNISTQEFWASTEAKRIYGFNMDSETFSTETVESCIPERERVHQALIDLIERNVPYNLEFDIITRDTRQRRTIMSLAELEGDPSGNPTRIRGVVQDISVRRKVEKSLRESEEKHRLIFENAGDAIFIHDNQGNILAVNTIACERLGYTQKELLSVAMDQIDVPEKTFTFEERTAGLLKNGHIMYETVHLHKDGTSIPIEGNTRLITWEGKSAVMNICRDITERRRAEEERKRLTGRLLQGQKMEAIGTLAGGIAHDFNNILSAVLGFTELALTAVDKKTPIEDDLKEVYTAGLRAKDLVQQILTFARQSDEEIKPIQVDFIIKEVLKFVRSSIPTTIEIKQNIVNDSFIMGNSSQFHRIMMNLCTNAAYAMEDRGGTLEISLKNMIIDQVPMRGKYHLKPGDYIEIKVSDTGEGIDPQIIDKIFEPYFTTKGPTEGTGMGLALVHGIIETYNGKIFVESTLGKGTAFTMYLPTIKRKKSTLPHIVNELPTGKERILFVDDEAPIAKIAKRILGKLGYAVTTRTSSTEALELFRSKPNNYDLVISDVTMPKMTGDQLTQKIIEIRPDIPVILCTGYSKKFSERSASKIGIKAFVKKPIIHEDLAKIVRRVLDDANNLR